MLGAATNAFVLLIFILIMIVEFIFARAARFSYIVPWIITTVFYIIFIGYQVLVKVNEDSEKQRVKILLNQIMDATDGIPLINRNEKIIIKWDIVFKKLIQNKAFGLYDKITKMKTKTIDHYINLYPSLLLDDATNLVETKNNVDLSSVIHGKGGADGELSNDKELKDKLFIRDIQPFKASFGNYDASLHVDVVLNNEYDPADKTNSGKLGGQYYDGFSVTAYYNNNKFVIVPPITILGKKINKEKWLFRNLARLMDSAYIILKGEDGYSIVADAQSIGEYLEDIKAADMQEDLVFVFDCLEDEHFIFSTILESREQAKAYCELKTGYNNFEIKLVMYEKTINGKLQKVETSQTVAIGSSYQPVVTILQRMPFVVRNVGLLMNNKDLTDIVIN